MKKSVLLLCFSPLRRDPRVLRQIKVLKEEFSISTCGFGAAPDFVDHHYEIPESEYGWWPKSLTFAGAHLAGRNYRTFYRNEPRVKYVLDAVPQGAFDVIFANDVETVPLARMLKPRGGVHADLHEWEPRLPGSGMKWRLNGLPYSRWHLRDVKRAASVTTVATGLAEAYDRQYGIAAQVVTNAADFVEAQPSEVQRPLRMVHSGGSNPARRLDLMVDAMRGLDNATLEFMLMPTGEGMVEALKDYAANVPNVTFRDPVPYDQLVKTLSTYDVGLFLLPPSNYNYEMALPNKLFEYVQARLAIVISPSPEMARIVEEFDLGLVAADFSAEAFHATLKTLTQESVRKYKENSHKAARELSSESAVGPWLDAARELASRAG